MVKWDSIKKHLSKRKTINDKWFMDSKCGRAKNEVANIQLLRTIVLQHLIVMDVNIRHHFLMNGIHP
jgi:hypothetical protein